MHRPKANEGRTLRTTPAAQIQWAPTPNIMQHSHNLTKSVATCDVAEVTTRFAAPWWGIAIQSPEHAYVCVSLLLWTLGFPRAWHSDRQPIERWRHHVHMKFLIYHPGGWYLMITRHHQGSQSIPHAILAGNAHLFFLNAEQPRHEEIFYTQEVLNCFLPPCLWDNGNRCNAQPKWRNTGGLLPFSVQHNWIVWILS